MNLVNYEPFKAMHRLQEEINQLFKSNDFFSNGLGDFDLESSEWVPSVNVKEEKKNFVISADIPGVDPNDIEVHMDQGVLTIKGERKTETKEEEKGYSRIECSQGTFLRRFSLPETADADKISAKGKNGVLEITIAKKPASESKKIEIKS